jgi:hypothetical protein
MPKDENRASQSTTDEAPAFYLIDVHTCISALQSTGLDGGHILELTKVWVVTQNIYLTQTWNKV